MKFEVPKPMRKKRTEKQQEFFINACEDNYGAKEFLQKETTLSKEEFRVIIHNIIFNAVKYVE